MPKTNDNNFTCRRLKLKRLGGKNDNVVAKKKRRIEPEDNSKMQSSSRAHKKVNTVLKKATPMPRAKSPVMMSQSSAKSKDRNRSDSPKLRTKDNDKERYCNKSRDFEDVSSKDAASKCKSVDRSKECDRFVKICSSKYGKIWHKQIIV